MRRLELDSEERPLMRRALRKLVASGQIFYGPNHLIVPGKLLSFSGENPSTGSDTADKKTESMREKPLSRHEKKKEKHRKELQSDLSAESKPRSSGRSSASSSNPWIVGSFRRSSSGVGFVRARDGEGSGEPGEDIFIAPHFTGDAMTGDLVAVEVFGKRGREKDRKPRRERGDREEDSRFRDRSPRTREEKGPRGRIMQIIERASQRFVGTYFEENDWGYVQVDGKVFQQPIEVGDPTANNARIDDKVVIEMVRYPSQYHAGEAVLIEVLGPHGVPGLDTQLIIREYQLPEHFTEQALRAARDQVVKFFQIFPEHDGEKGENEGTSDPKVQQYLHASGRTDLSEEFIITIDPPDAKDFDDAISLEKMDNGHWNLGVHIADVSHFVEAGSPIDRDAKDRATSVYLPDRVIPMLPEVLSNSLASLQPKKLRFTLSVFMEFTSEGIRCNTEIHKSLIRSSARLNYDEVQEFLDHLKGGKADDSSTSFSPEVSSLLEKMYELSRILKDRRVQRGALEMNMPEIKIDLDPDGKVIGAHAEIQNESHQIIEEFMLCANEAVAEFLTGNQIPFLRRVHKFPAYRKIKQFADFLRWMKLDDLSPEELLESRFAIQDILKKVADRKEKAAVHFALLRAMQRAVYTPEEEGHYALASPCYSHFTSPIRRYPDLSVHRILKEFLEGKKPKADLNELHLLGLHCSERERRAEDAERELNKLKLIDFMSRNIGMEMDAVISGTAPAGIFVLGTEIPAEGLIPLTSLSDDAYKYDRDTRSITARRSGREFRLGDAIRVRVVRADPNEREIDFQWIPEE